MNIILQYLIDFIGIYLIIFIVYRVFINKKREDYEKLKKSSEVRIVINRYHLNMKRLNIKI